MGEMLGAKADDLKAKLEASDRGTLRQAADMLNDRRVPAERLAYLLSRAGHPISSSTIKAYRRRLDMDATILEEQHA